MSLLKSSFLVMAAASLVVVSGVSAEAQSRTTHHRSNTNQGMNGGMGGTSPTQSSIQGAQNQARSIAAQQHQVWLAHRLKKNAAEKAAKANGIDTKSAAKSTATAKSTTTAETTTKPTSTATTTTAKPATK
jgi:hypothetical protein